MKRTGPEYRSYKLFVSAALALALAACGGGKTVVESNLGIKGAPDWVNKGTNILNDKDGRLFHGVGSAPAMGDESLQVSTADDRARGEVARVLSSYMDVVSNDYRSATGTGADATSEQAISREVKAVSKINLSGARIIGRWKDPNTKMVYSIAELDLKHVKQTVQAAKDMNADLRGYFDRNADNVFDKVAKGSGK